MLVAKSVKESLEKSSWIRQMFEQGRRLREEFGPDEVFDFSLGNPMLEPPQEFRDTAVRLLTEDSAGKHAYMPNGGFPETRQFIADQLSEETGFSFEMDDVVMCVGAGGGLNVIFKSLLDPGDEVMVLAPYFVEYRSYVQNHQGVLKEVATTESFQIDLQAIEEAITPKTRALIINSPNNPTGVVYSQESITALGNLLSRKEKELGQPIFLISDEPYRYLLFDGLKPTTVFTSHPHSIMVTSHSKDLGLAGERIGFIAIHPKMLDRHMLQQALVFSNRTLGFVNAPALMQRILPHLGQARVPIKPYEELRDMIYPSLIAMGFEIPKPQGAFFMFPKTPIDDVSFVQAALEERILLVPGSGFGAPGYVRLAFCCKPSLVEKALPRFENLAKRFF